MMCLCPEDMLLTDEQLSSLKDDPNGDSFEQLFSRFSQMKGDYSCSLYILSL